MIRFQKNINRVLLVSIIATSAMYVPAAKATEEKKQTGTTKKTNEPSSWDAIWGKTQEYSQKGWTLFKENIFTDTGSFDANHMAGVLCGATLAKHPWTSVLAAAGFILAMPLIEDALFSGHKLANLVKELELQSNDLATIKAILERAKPGYVEPEKKTNDTAPITSAQVLIEKVNAALGGVQDQAAEPLRQIIKDFEKKNQDVKLQVRAARLGAGAAVGFAGNFGIAFIANALS